jgi:hypothetical protein
MPAQPGLHQTTEVAQQTHGTSINMEGEITSTASALNAATHAAIPAHWRGMEQVTAFTNVEAKFQGIMTEVLNAMRMMGTGTIQSMVSYIDTDELEAAAITAKTDNGVQFGHLTRLIG